jgi:transposase
VACTLLPCPSGQPRKEVRTFGTMTQDILALRDWLEAQGCTHVAMEATGVFWHPVYNLLEGGALELLVVNAQHIKNVPGRKTDVKDAEWIATLLRHGLLRTSFIPPRPQRELRELTRYRSSVRAERADEVNRLQKTLESANIKLASVGERSLLRVGISCSYQCRAWSDAGPASERGGPGLREETSERKVVTLDEGN